MSALVRRCGRVACRPNLQACPHEVFAMTPAKSKSWFTRFAKGTAYATGRPATFVLALDRRRGVGDQRPALPLERHLAARDQHRHHHRHLPHGVPDPEHAEPRCGSRADQARRAAARHARRAQRAHESRGARRARARAHPRGVREARREGAPRRGRRPQRRRRAGNRRAGGSEETRAQAQVSATWPQPASNTASACSSASGVP